MTRGRETPGRRVHEAAVDARRLRHAAAHLRREPALQVRLVPDRPQVHVREVRAGSPYELAELAGVRVGRGALPRRGPVGRRAAELEEDGEPARLGATHDLVVGTPSVDARVGAVGGALLRGEVA